MLNNLPQGWSQPRFGQIYKRVKRKQGDQDLPVLSVTVDGIVLQADHFNKKVASADTSDYLRVRRGEVAMSGLNLWKGGIDTQRIVPEGVVSPAYKVYSLRTDAADADFMAHYLRSPPLFSIYKDVSQQGASIVRRNVDFDALHAYRLPLPPLPEQKKIAAILSSVDEAIQATEAVIEQTRRVKDGLLQDLLTRGIGHTRFKQTEIGEIPESWEVWTMAQLAAKNGMVGGPFGSDLTASDYVPAPGVPVIRGANVSPSEFIPHGFVYVTAEKAESLRRNTASRGDLIMTQRGASLGQAALIPHDAEFETYIVSQTMMRMTPDPRKVLADFLIQYVSSPVGQGWLQGQQTGNAQPHLNLTIFRNMPAPVPPLSEQEDIARRCGAMDEAVEANEARLQQLAVVKTGLLQDLLTGTVRVSA